MDFQTQSATDGDELRPITPGTSLESHPERSGDFAAVLNLENGCGDLVCNCATDFPPPLGLAHEQPWFGSSALTKPCLCSPQASSSLGYTG